MNANEAAKFRLRAQKMTSEAGSARALSQPCQALLSPRNKLPAKLATGRRTND